MKILIILSIVIMSVGCMAVSKSKIASAQYPVLPTDYKEQANKQILATLKDHYSAHIEVMAPRKGYSRDGIAYGGKTHFGYYIPVKVNAKNSYGAYTGDQIHWLFYSDTGWGFDTPSGHSGMTGFSE